MLNDQSENFQQKAKKHKNGDRKHTQKNSNEDYNNQNKYISRNLK